jgi:transcriptional regulator with XRE-family HTH domain
LPPERPLTLPSPDRIQLGAELRRLRDATGKTIDEVSRELSAQLGPGFSPTKLSRLETGKRPANQRDVRDLCLYYGASPDELTRLVEMAKASRVQNRWQGLTDAYAEYVALEQIASGVRAFETMLVPGLLQTADYSRAMAVGSALDWTAVEDEGADLEIKINVRLTRQQRLYGDAPMDLHVIFDENILHRAIGGAKVMAAQLRHIEEASRLPNVTVQVVPVSLGAYPGLESAGFSILDFAYGTYPQDYVCFIESSLGAVWAEREAERLRITRVFEYIKGVALNPSDTQDVLKSAIRSLARTH